MLNTAKNGLDLKPRISFIAELTRRIGWGKEEVVAPTGYRLLLAHHEESLLEILKSELARGGFEIDEARDGKTALQLLEKKEYDLMTLDVVMPGVSSMTVLKEMK